MPWTLHTKKATDQCTERKQRTHTAHCSLWSGQRDSVPISGKQSTDLIVIQVNPSLILIQCFRGPQQQHQQHQGRVVLQHKPTCALFSFSNRTPNTHSSCAATQTHTCIVLIWQQNPKHPQFWCCNTNPHVHCSHSATEPQTPTVLVLQHKPTCALFSFSNRTPNTHSSGAATQITIYSVLVDKAFHPKHKVCS